LFRRLIIFEVPNVTFYSFATIRKMKRILVSILAIVYLAATAGATVHMHYCMGDLAGWSLMDSKKDECPYCGMEKKSAGNKGCCKDEHHKVQLEQDQNTAAVNMVFAPAVAILPSPVYLPAAPSGLCSVTEERPLSNSPPRSCSIPVYLINRSFLI
jgi:hypothetical protein